MSCLAVVIIGRNEGERLRRCLASVAGCAACIVYVDSGSSDGSVAMAREMGVEVVELDASIPFTAARARNEGFERSLAMDSQIDYVQFVDGDCEVIDGWLDAAAKHLDEHSEVTVVCGRLRERHPETSVYNRLCEIEWDGPAGESVACGGICMMRAAEFSAVGGYDPRVIAAEDDELCIRLRRRGGKVWRLELDMAWHDAAMSRFGQWWRRAVRAGHAFAQVNAMHGGPPLFYFRREVRSALVWGAAIPAALITLGLVTQWWIGLAGASLYALLIVRIAWRMRRRGLGAGDAVLYGVNCVAAKWPHVVGIGRYWWRRWWRKPAMIIEHKRPAASST